MKKGSIISQIVKEISLANYEDDTPLARRVEWFLLQALPPDIYGWFMKQVGEKPLSGKQGRRLVEWLCKDVKKAIINTENIKKIRRARKEQFIDILREEMPTQAVMANITKEQLNALDYPEDIIFYLIPHLSNAIKRDEDTIAIAIDWAKKKEAISLDDILWMLRYCKPTNEYTQVLLLAGKPEETDE